jgi:hypothetical protein
LKVVRVRADAMQEDREWHWARRSASLGRNHLSACFLCNIQSKVILTKHRHFSHHLSQIVASYLRCGQGAVQLVFCFVIVDLAEWWPRVWIYSLHGGPCFVLPCLAYHLVSNLSALFTSLFPSVVPQVRHRCSQHGGEKSMRNVLNSLAKSDE